jgi:hypothetical protein
MKREFKPMSWIVKRFDINHQVIEDYDILKYREDFIKKLKKKCTTKEEFAKGIKNEMQYIYWSRSEYELIIEITEDNRVFLNPWVGCREPEKVRIDVTNDESFDWYDFAKYHIGKQIYGNKAKIDCYNQLKWVWDDFVDYCWNYRHKWQRKK